MELEEFYDNDNFYVSLFRLILPTDFAIVSAEKSSSTIKLSEEENNVLLLSLRKEAKIPPNQKREARATCC